MSVWNYIKADPFFKNHMPHIKGHKFKIRGFNSRNKPTDFTIEEKKQIKQAILKLVKGQEV